MHFQQMAPSLCVLVIFCYQLSFLCFRAKGESTAAPYEMDEGTSVCVGDIEFNPVIKHLFFTTKYFYGKTAMLVNTLDGKHYVFQIIIVIYVITIVTFGLVQIETHIFIYVHTCPRVNNELPAVCVSNITILLWSSGKMVLSVRRFAPFVFSLSLQCFGDALVMSQACPQVST